jgi:23S rRNA (adenine2503-C2)-methyltransferase
MINKFIKKNSPSTYRVTQFNKHYYQEFISSWDELTTWPRDLREKIKNEIPFSRLEVINSSISKDGKVHKVLFSTEKNNSVESVLIKDQGRNTVCVSCMSGCPVGCIFCATGQMGLREHLTEEQIIDQILYFARILKADSERITNIVYMGMGEPMLNLDNVARSIEILTNKEKFALSKRRVTLSTSGHIQNLTKFLNMKYNVILAISLHAPNQTLRDRLMPNISPQNKLKDLFKLLDRYTKESNKRVTYEYVLLRGINDSVKEAKELAFLLKDRLCLVNLIDYNENNIINLKKSKNTVLFHKILVERGINCTIRKSYGDDIKGACGQLGTQYVY